MNEDELKVLGYDDADDPILPSGWKEGDDIFAPETWSHETDQTDESGAEGTETQDSETEKSLEELLTTDDSEQTEDQSAVQESETDPADPGQGEQEEVKEPSTRILHLKVNHQGSDVDVNAMSDEELISALQKANAFDAMKDDQLKDKYRTVYQDEIDAGMTEATARLVAMNECGGKSFPLEDEVDDGTPDEETRPSAPVRDLAAEVEQLKTLYPNFKEMPDEVAKAVASGAPLLTAYVAYREQQTNKTAASLRKENEVLRQNAASAAKAPVRGVSGGGVAQKKQNLALQAFDDDALY